MHQIRVVRPQYDQSRPFSGQVGEVIGHWGSDNSTDGRSGYLVLFPGDKVVSIAFDEAEDVFEP